MAPRLLCFWRLLLTVLFFAYVFRTFLFTSVANAWIVNEPLVKADAIVMLGGGLGTGPLQPPGFTSKDMAARILLMNVKLSPAAQSGITQSEKDITRQVLLSRESQTRIASRIGDAVASTYDEAPAVRAWLVKTEQKASSSPPTCFTPAASAGSS